MLLSYLESSSKWLPDLSIPEYIKKCENQEEQKIMSKTLPVQNQAEELHK